MQHCELAASEDPQAQVYISILLANIEYDVFIGIMQSRKKDVIIEKYAKAINSILDDWEADIKERDQRKELEANKADLKKRGILGMFFGRSNSVKLVERK